MKRFLASLLLALGLALSGYAGAQATAPFTQIIVFGDSLSDSGNVFSVSGSPPPPYFGGRFTNGLVWPEVLASTWDVPLTNYAYGGALTGITNSGNPVNPTGGSGSVYDPGAPFPTTAPQPGTFPLPGMMSQVLAYATGVQIALQGGPTAPGAIIPDPGALYVVFAGGNDFLALASQPPEVLGAFGASLGLNPFDPNFQSDLIGEIIFLALTNITSANPIDYLGGAVQAPAGAVPLLYGLGARNIAVVNLPDLSLSPAAAAGGPAIQGAFAQTVAIYNSLLSTALGALTGALPGVNIIEVDAGALLQNAVANPAAFGLENVTAPCVETGCFLNPDIDPNTYLFWDSVHPTATVHEVVAMTVMEEAEESMEPPPPPVSVPVVVAAANGGSGAVGPWMLLFGLLLIGFARRRPQIL
ncbi:MAG: SGNH/GDSL hydrolase family protein [Gammaproteobacteria bacterium]|nr:SGNH/GDSL hydrolase family protein [Gammaproteobacteria bacterium]